MKGKKLKMVIKYMAGIVAGLILVSFLLRNILLSFYMDRKIDRFNKEYHAILKVDKSRIKNISTFQLTGVSLKPENGDSFLTIDTAYASLNFWKMIFGHIVVSNLELTRTCISLVQVDTIDNFQFLLRGMKKKAKKIHLKRGTMQQYCRKL